MKTAAQIIDQLCPVIISETGLFIGPALHKKLCDRLADFIYEDLEVFLMTDQPPTCPQCGRRVTIIEGATSNKQVCRCPGCAYMYRLEEDES